jgi:hypothetical protein
MMTKELAMQPRWYGIFVAAWLAGCTSPSPGASQAVPDHFDDNLGVLIRSIAHPCGADIDSDGDGKVDVHYTYTYDALGRSLRDVGVDLDGKLYAQTDYTWDNAGHLIRQLDVFGGVFRTDATNVYDTLGRQTRYQTVGGTLDTPETSTTIDYSNFDELGHASHGETLYKDLTAGTSQMLSRSYGYDDLGRRISLDVHFEDTGELFQGWRHTYDDVAHTVTTNLTAPLTLSRMPGNTYVYVNTYDADAHWLSYHSVAASLDGTPYLTTDQVNQWDGDRELSSMISDVSLTGTTSRSSTTFKYQCDSTHVATDHLPASTLPPPAHLAFLRRPRIE